MCWYDFGSLFTKNAVAEIEDFKRRETIKKISELIGRIRLCMFCTKLGYIPFASRPMTTIKVDDDGRIWFFSNAGSHKNAEIKHQHEVELLYMDQSGAEFLAIHGTAEILKGREKCMELWNFEAVPWFPKGPEDSELTIVVVTPILGHHWRKKQYALLRIRPTEQSVTAGTPGQAEEAIATA